MPVIQTSTCQIFLLVFFNVSSPLLRVIPVIHRCWHNHVHVHGQSRGHQPATGQVHCNLVEYLPLSLLLGRKIEREICIQIDGAAVQYKLSIVIVDTCLCLEKCYSAFFFRAPSASLTGLYTSACW